MSFLSDLLAPKPDEIRKEVESWPEELKEAWDEKSAIMEIDGCLPRDKAELEAWRQFNPRPPVWEQAVKGSSL